MRQGFSRGATLIRQGDPGTDVLALVAGRVKVVAGNADGAGLLTALRGPGDLVGELARPVTGRTATVVAIDDCAVARLSAAGFRRFLEQRGHVGSLQDYLVAKLSETVPFQVQLVHLSARQRIARLLIELVSLTDPADPHRMRIPLSQEKIAEALGVVRSTVSEQLAVLRDSGALGPGPRVVVRDLAELTIHAGLRL
ncbi:cAMP-binding domain of CRP or a regulatory subunit of cAMP-dependent protein kinases [Actinokineospora iranica]|uniref:cAMP-binding domain of CRP or a regulatory subunit of cAMP-dependent protein kinases n=1 Tax=Actinokineospora iranica TaxID=1271860 RepID=A0A1G6TM48_9PSEU|nr:cAMP-binding domain of CRP or a regulatory subunit of cAMP-dependent protein kinases [Actinokineospora iranica]